MSYRFIYAQPEAAQIIQAVITDRRNDIPQIKNKVGAVIKAYIDAIVAQVTDDTVFYRIETNLGVLAGYMLITFEGGNVNEPVGSKLLRPAFVQFDTGISAEISSFILAGIWKYDHL